MFVCVPDIVRLFYDVSCQTVFDKLLKERDEVLAWLLRDFSCIPAYGRDDLID